MSRRCGSLKKYAQNPKRLSYSLNANPTPASLHYIIARHLPIAISLDPNPVVMGETAGKGIAIFNSTINTFFSFHLS
jgi:hypothetical protein